MTTTAIAYDSDGQYLWELPQFDAIPARKPREGVLSEHIFAARWAALMAKDDGISAPNQELSYILHRMRQPISQRAATVAASVVCWYGTPIGRAFLDQAEVLAKVLLSRQDAYLAAWSIQNFRRNPTARTIEHCLGPEEGRKEIPQATPYDIEVADHVAYWMGSEDGQKFLRGCREEIAHRRPEQDLDFHLSAQLRLPRHEVNAVLGMAKAVAAESRVAQ